MKDEKEISVQMQFTPFLFHLRKINQTYDAVEENAKKIKKVRKSSTSFCTEALLLKHGNNSSVCVILCDEARKIKSENFINSHT